MPSDGAGTKKKKVEMPEAHKLELRKMAEYDKQARAGGGGRRGVSQSDTYWATNRQRIRAAYKAAGWTDAELDEIESGA